MNTLKSQFMQAIEKINLAAIGMEEFNEPETLVYHTKELSSSAATLRKIHNQLPDGPDPEVIRQLLNWYLNGETGLSSQTIASVMLDDTTGAQQSYPHDGKDLRRCMLLLRAIPEALSALDVLEQTNVHWQELAADWPLLTKSMAQELGPHLDKNSDTPQTNIMIQLALMRADQRVTRDLD